MTRESLIASYKKAHPQALGYKERADAIIKSLDKSRLQRVPIVDKNGVHKHAWKNPNKKAKEKNKPAQQRKPDDIPTIELEPLRDIREAEIRELSRNNQKIKELSSLIRSRLTGKCITNKASGDKILITKEGINKTIHPGKNVLGNYESRESLFYLEQILEHSNADFEDNKYIDTEFKNKQNFDKAGIYQAKYELNGKTYKSKVITRIFLPKTLKGKIQNNFHQVMAIEIEPVGCNVRPNFLAKRLPEHNKPTDSNSKPYPSNGDKSREV